MHLSASSLLCLILGNNPILPDNLDRLEMCFTLPSPKELLCHAYMVCTWVHFLSTELFHSANANPHYKLFSTVGLCCRENQYSSLVDRAIYYPLPGRYSENLDASSVLVPREKMWTRLVAEK